MLSRRMARCLQACLKATFSSASSDVAHADAHGDYKVHIDKNATWIKYRSVALRRHRIPN